MAQDRFGFDTVCRSNCQLLGYLTLWVALCIVVGIGLGSLLPDVFTTIAAAEVARVNLVVAVLIWLMIIPMLLKIDFGSLGSVRQHWKGVGVTLFINWAVTPVGSYAGQRANPHRSATAPMKVLTPAYRMRPSWTGSKKQGRQLWPPPRFKPLCGKRPRSNKEVALQLHLRLRENVVGADVADAVHETGFLQEHEVALA